MSYSIIDGKAISKKIKEEVRERVDILKKSDIVPTLAVILVGENKASQIYVRNKKLACEETHIKSISYELPESTTESELLELIGTLNTDEKISGILVQLPLPKQINEQKVLLKIDYRKDVDGFNPYNVGLLQVKNAYFEPCTPAGIIELLKRSNIEIEGKHCVIIGRSNIVGKPVATMLLSENATVTIAHSRTKNLKALTLQADILVVCIGVAKFLTKDMIKEDVIIIDVGINHLDGKLCGDVDFESCNQKCSFITPVPGGVGPMTIAMLMHNCALSCELRKSKD